MSAADRLSALAAPTPQTPLLLTEAAPRVVVVGDVILDGWWHGDIERLCREAPAPVVELRRREEAAGGGANTAVNAARLGAHTAVAGIVGTDRAGQRLRALLEDSGVDCSGLVAHAEATTTSKSRIVGGEQILVRLDEQGGPPPAPALAELAARLPGLLAGADAVVVCDYGSGALRGAVRAALLDLLGNRDPRVPGTPPGSPAAPLVVVDAHDPRPWRALNPDVATPNAAEALRLLDGAGAGPAPLEEPAGTEEGDAPDRAAGMQRHRTQLLEATGAGCVVVTLDRDGTIALPRLAPAAGSAAGTTGSTPGTAGSTPASHRTWARPATEKQASGAGDTFVACLTVGLAAGLPLPTALDLAQAAADVVVHRQGTSVCTTADLHDHLGGLALAAVDAEELAALVAEHRAAGRRIVLTNGCFDVLHRGHTRYLEQAKQLGHVLVVALNDDDSVRRLKGPDRPINPAADRAAVLAALSCVDHVTVFSSDTPIPLLERLRPEIYAKGGDYTPEMLEEARTVEEYGGHVAILDYVADHSTTEVLRRIRTAEAGA